MAKANVLFLLVLASLPIQLNKFFFTPDSSVLGIPIDYLALNFYLSDFFILTFIITAFAENFKNLPQIIRRQKILIIALTLFNFYLLGNTALVSRFFIPAIIFNLKILEFSLLSILGTVYFSKPGLWGKISRVLAFSLVWASAVIALEFIFQKSLGLWILGERAFDSTTTSIAHFEIAGIQSLRPYGTFPHPNVAAAFLVIFSLLLASYHQKRLNLRSLPLAAVAIILTFSKAAILASFLGLFILHKYRPLLLVFLLPVIFILIFSGPIPEIQIQSLAERFTLAQASLTIARENLAFGVGTANFIPALSQLDLFSSLSARLLQPVHNVFLLILAEGGLVGLGLFVALIVVVALKAGTLPKLSLFVVLLVFLSVDHFLWTLQQGQMLFFLTVAFILANSTNNV